MSAASSAAEAVSKELFQAARATLRAISASNVTPRRGMVESSPGQPVWHVDLWITPDLSFHVTGSARWVIIRRGVQVAGKCKITLLYEWTAVAEMDVTEFTYTLCALIIGRPTIPPQSRRELKAALRRTEAEMRYVFASGVSNRLQASVNQFRWLQWDGTWESIQLASDFAKHPASLAPLEIDELCEHHAESVAQELMLSITPALYKEGLAL